LWLAGVQGASIIGLAKVSVVIKLLYEHFISNSRIDTLLESHEFNFPNTSPAIPMNL
jgi:hypothetical protein